MISSSVSAPRAAAGPKRRFVSQDDAALNVSRSLRDGTIRLGGIDPDQEPYRTDFAREKLEVFDLTRLRGRAHSRAFDEVTSVMSMIQERLVGEEQIADRRSPAGISRR
ncbi:hypothetical protein BST63_01920 [Bradyrhizobium canariense]|uniref:Uncharacterized protein n=2 Tax=Nitrobacteraceae TaxID=41294 RepID=A0ABX3XAS8_9BRAD|nr:hypothetical protein BSR47_02045 [Bradyrhizobium canariense]OSJ35426.1 hypothetical protein BST63_01920 [Bradyrhizobium canariense]